MHWENCLNANSVLAREEKRRVASLPLSSLPVIETSMSRVFLGSDRVWKVKKAVKADGLDWRTPSARRRACWEELCLGPRLADGVYRAVVPITRGARGLLEVRGSGPVVDWAVEMVRLPQAQRFDARLADGRLGAGSIGSLAEHLAQFHSAAARGLEVERHASPAILSKRIENGLARASRAEGGDEVLIRIAERQRAGLRSHREAVQARRVAGRICEGHGDLRCEHVYLDDAGGIAVLDPLGGPRALRCADVCSDIAMLSVDLLGRGRTDLAERLLAAYAGATDDYDLYTVVDFYERQRAFERACTAAPLARDVAVTEELRRRAAREERKYTQLAIAIDRPALLPRTIVATTGLVASGKSTVAAALADRMGVPRIVADTARRALVRRDSCEQDDLSARLRSLSREFDHRVYAEALRCAAVVLASGRGVVLDACFPTAATRAGVAELAARHETPLVFVECRAPSDAIRARLIDRSAAEGTGVERWIAWYDALASRYEAPDTAEGGEHLVANTVEALDSNLARLKERIPTWPVGAPE